MTLMLMWSRGLKRSCSEGPDNFTLLEERRKLAPRFGASFRIILLGLTVRSYPVCLSNSILVCLVIFRAFLRNLLEADFPQPTFKNRQAITAAIGRTRADRWKHRFDLCIAIPRSFHAVNVVCSLDRTAGWVPITRLPLHLTGLTAVAVPAVPSAADSASASTAGKAPAASTMAVEDPGGFPGGAAGIGTGKFNPVLRAGG